MLLYELGMLAPMSIRLIGGIAKKRLRDVVGSY